MLLVLLSLFLFLLLLLHLQNASHRTLLGLGKWAMGRRCFNLLKSHVTYFKYWGPSDISGTGKARIVKSCTQVDCIKSYLLDDKPPLKGVWSGSHDPFSIFTPQLYPRNGWSERRQILCVCTIYQVLALGWQTTPPLMGVVAVTWSV